MTTASSSIIRRSRKGLRRPFTHLRSEPRVLAGNPTIVACLPTAPHHNADMKTLTTELDVLIVGAGPTGLTLAAELALAGVNVAILERRADQAIAGARAGGLHPRTLEMFDQRGIVQRFVEQGQKYPVVLFPGATLATGDLPSRHAYWLGLWQENIERTLA